MKAWFIWLGAVLAIAMGCEGAIGTREFTGEPRSVDAGVPPIDLPDGSVEPPMDAGMNPDSGMDPDAGMNPDAGPCANCPFATPLPSCQPTPVPNTGDPHADCVARINQFRWDCQCLPPLARWTDGEACADGNAEYDSINGPHASFTAQPCGSGARAQNECPGWGSNEQVIDGCLQVMWDEGPEDGDPGTVNGHYMNMSSISFSQVACGFYTTPGGQVWGVQNFD